MSCQHPSLFVQFVAIRQSGIILAFYSLISISWADSDYWTMSLWPELWLWLAGPWSAALGIPQRPFFLHCCLAGAKFRVEQDGKDMTGLIKRSFFYLSFTKLWAVYVGVSGTGAFRILVLPIDIVYRNPPKVIIYPKRLQFISQLARTPPPPPKKKKKNKKKTHQSLENIVIYSLCLCHQLLQLLQLQFWQRQDFESPWNPSINQTPSLLGTASI